MNTKSILTSKTIWGALLALLPALLSLFGLDTLPGFQEQASAVVEQVITLVGGALAIYGRIVATKQLVVTTPKGDAAAK